MCTYLLDVFVNSASRSHKYFGEFTLITSFRRICKGAESLFKYVYHWMFGNFFCKSAIFIGLYIFSSTLDSFGTYDNFARLISKSNESRSSFSAQRRLAPKNTAMSTIYLKYSFTILSPKPFTKYS